MINGAGDGNRTRMMFPSRDFKSLASACSATPAYNKALNICEPLFIFFVLYEYIFLEIYNCRTHFYFYNNNNYQYQNKNTKVVQVVFFLSFFSFSIYIILYFFKFVKQDSFCLVPPRLTTSLPTHMVGQGRFELPNQLRSGFTVQFLLFKSFSIYIIYYFLIKIKYFLLSQHS